MKTLEEVLQMPEMHINQTVVEQYIVRGWVRPLREPTGWHFEEIDIARMQLVHHLTQDIQVNEQGMDVVLSLLDQLYGLRARIQKVKEAIKQQPSEVQSEILKILCQLTQTEEF